VRRCGAYAPALVQGEEFPVCATVTVRIPLLPEFIDANTATGQFVVEIDRYVRPLRRPLGHVQAAAVSRPRPPSSRHPSGALRRSAGHVPALSRAHHLLTPHLPLPVQVTGR
jgi:hypothetical protein